MIDYIRIPTTTPAHNRSLSNIRSLTSNGGSTQYGNDIEIQLKGRAQMQSSHSKLEAQSWRLSTHSCYDASARETLIVDPQSVHAHETYQYIFLEWRQHRQNDRSQRDRVQRENCTSRQKNTGRQPTKIFLVGSPKGEQVHQRMLTSAQIDVLLQKVASER